MYLIRLLLSKIVQLLVLEHTRYDRYRKYHIEKNQFNLSTFDRTRPQATSAANFLWCIAGEVGL